ncbi:hypothetical protein NA56DRAFT_702150 [Hyaloscypha hepaticicola]|uniref:Uncharacterized protein n=1 Tax=Hyaloscypha hepaticicola TaxID=2082293 RepID=A0A2J6Q9U2_9HELO|nr:hypothetical protein NA56DRAFT_702150 [Hyaloscypha hepaticicola]
MNESVKSTTFAIDTEVSVTFSIYHKIQHTNDNKFPSPNPRGQFHALFNVVLSCYPLNLASPPSSHPTSPILQSTLPNSRPANHSSQSLLINMPSRSPDSRPSLSAFPRCDPQCDKPPSPIGCEQYSTFPWTWEMVYAGWASYGGAGIERPTVDGRCNALVGSFSSGLVQVFFFLL